jgi:hypothetical protein
MDSLDFLEEPNACKHKIEVYEEKKNLLMIHIIILKFYVYFMFYTCGVWDGRKHARIEKKLPTCGNYNYIL